MVNNKSLWKSVLSRDTSHLAEYIALSMCMRELLPLKRLLKEINNVFKFDLEGALAKSTVFEDNALAVQLATMPKMTPRSKHIALHHSVAIACYSGKIGSPYHTLSFHAPTVYRTTSRDSHRHNAGKKNTRPKTTRRSKHNINRGSHMTVSSIASATRHSLTNHGKAILFII